MLSEDVKKELKELLKDCRGCSLPSGVTYGDRELEIVRVGGIEAIRAVFMGEDTESKASLLLALDWFMDPYYENRKDIEPFHDELVELLQEVIFSAEDADVAEEAWGLLNGYEEPPFEIIESRLDQLPPSLSWWVPRELEEMKKLQAEWAAEQAFEPG